jgi:peptide/nickel transport system substrate-binding protein
VTAGTGPIRAAFADAMDSLDPLMYIDSRVLILCIFDSLARTRADGSLAPGLATSWTSNADATVWHFKIRAGARWSDGTPVTPDDIVFTFQTIAATVTSPNRPYLSSLDHVETAGDDDIVFTLKRPFASWPRQVTLIPIAPRKAYTAMGAAGFAVHPVGSGPYRVTGFERGERLDLTANPDYWGGPPPVRQVTFVHVTDSVARFNALQSGDLDVIPLTPQQVALARKLPGVSVETAPSNRVVYLGLNVDRPNLASSDLRHAIDDAIDRGAISRYLLDGLAHPIGQLVSAVTFGHAPSVEATAFDPAKARALIAESGFGADPITFQYPTDGAIPLSSAVAEAIEGYLTNAGLTIRMRGMDQRSLVADWHSRKMTGLYMFSYNPSTMDAGLVTSSLLGPDGVRYFSSPEMDALEARQQAEADETERAGTFARMWGLNKDQAWYLPLFNDTYNYATVDSRVSFTPRGDGYIIAQDLRPPGQ